MDWLKDVLGEELYNQVSNKLLESDKKIKLVNGVDGSYVPKNKFDRINEQKKDLQQQVMDLQQQVMDLQDISSKCEILQKDASSWKEQAGQVPVLKEKIGDWETTANDLQSKLSDANKKIEIFLDKEQEYLEKIKNVQISSALEKILMKNNTKYPDLVINRFDRTRIEITEEGIVKGIDEQLEKIKQEYKDMFGKEKITGGRLNPGGKKTNTGQDTTKERVMPWERQ